MPKLVLGLDFVEKAFTMNSLRFLLVHRSPAQSEPNCSTFSTSKPLGASRHRVWRKRRTLLRWSGSTRFCWRRSFKLAVSRNSARTCGKWNRRNAGRVHVPVIGLANEGLESPETWLDAVIPEPIDPDVLTVTVLKLAQAVMRSPNSGSRRQSGRDRS